MTERDIGDEHPGAAARHERAASSRDQLLEEPSREWRSDARVHDGDRVTVDRDPEDGVLSDLADQDVDLFALVA